MNWSYYYKHWFSTLLFSPIVSQIIMYIYNLNPNRIVGLLEMYPLSIIFGLIFSIPTYILYAFLYYYLSNKKLKTILKKIVLISFAVFGIIITTIIIKGDMMLEIAISYTIASIVSGIFFKLNFKEKQ